MKTLCPVCELWLVDLNMVGGEGNFWCLRCESNENMTVLPGLSDSKAAKMSHGEGNLEKINEDG